MLLPVLFAWITAVPPRKAAVESLPLVMIAPAAPASGTLAVLVTGDGGWSHADRTVAEKLAADGDGVVGLNSLHYFAHKRTSAGMASDVSAVAREACDKWSCQRIVLIGYSMGADVLPFVVNQLDTDVRSKVEQLDLVSLGHIAVFKFFPTQWLGVTVGQKFATLPALATIHGLDIVCIYGTTDSDPACRDLPQTEATIIPLNSGHVMTKVAADLADVISSNVSRLKH